MEVKGAEYRVWYDEGAATVFFDGRFRLSSPEYGDLEKLLMQVAAMKPPQIKLDLTSLVFLNSSGINVLAKFVIGIRKEAATALTVLGTLQIPWQGKSLPNLKKLHPALELVIV